MVRKFIAVSMQSLKYIYDGHFEEAVDALIKARPNAKIPRAINLARFEEYRDLLVTDATKGKPWGYMAPRDWEVAIKNMKDAGVVPAKFKATDFLHQQVRSDGHPVDRRLARRGLPAALFFGAKPGGPRSYAPQ